MTYAHPEYRLRDPHAPEHRCAHCGEVIDTHPPLIDGVGLVCVFGLADDRYPDDPVMLHGWCEDEAKRLLPAESGR